MAQMAQAISAMAENQKQLNETAQQILDSQRPDARYIAGLEQGSAPAGYPEPTDWNQMTQSQMAKVILTEVGQAMTKASGQYGQMLRTILPDHEIWKPNIRDEVSKLVAQGVPFDQAYDVVKNRKQQPAAQNPEAIQAEIDKRVKAELDKRERVGRASVASKPGMVAAQAAHLSPREQFAQDWQKHIVEGEELPAANVRGL